MCQKTVKSNRRAFVHFKTVLFQNNNYDFVLESCTVGVPRSSFRLYNAEDKKETGRRGANGS